MAITTHPPERSLPGHIRAAYLAGRAWIGALPRWISERHRLFGLTVVIGGLCGLAAVAFHVAIDAVTAATVDRALSARGYGWIVWTILTPVLGSLACGALLQFVVPNARGSGIPEVKVVYARRTGRLRFRDSVGKFVVSALQIGTGSSLGREGPTVHICAGIASLLGRLSRVSARNLRRLLPVGAAAGIAAAFNAPIAAVTFTTEEIVGQLDQTILSGVIVAAAVAGVVERSVLGEHPILTTIQSHGPVGASSLLLYAILGVVAAGISILFTDSLLAIRARFRTASRLPGFAGPAIGGLVTGVLAVLAVVALRSRGVTGSGYDTLGAALGGKLAVHVLLALCLLKLAATVFCYGSGGAGGIFAPSLFIGGMLGGAFGALDVALFDHSAASMGDFALVGMGAVFAGIIRAPITSILIIIEMTSGYSLILPLMIANMSSYAIARLLRPSAIYDALLEQDGIRLPDRGGGDGREQVPLSDVPLSIRPYAALLPGHGATEMLKASGMHDRQEVFPVVDPEGRLLGIITGEDLVLLAEEPHLQGIVNASDVMHPAPDLRPEHDLRQAFEAMRSAGLTQLPVLDGERRVLGLIDEGAIARAYMQVRAAGQSAGEK